MYGDGEPLGHDLTRADRTPNGVEGDVDSVHGVGGGMSGKGRTISCPGLITQLVPPGTRVASELLYYLFCRCSVRDAIEIRSCEVCSPIRHPRLIGP